MAERAAGRAPRRRVSLTTVVWGVLLLGVAGLVILHALTGILVDPVLAVAVALLGAGVILIVGVAMSSGRSGGGRRRR